MNPQNRQAVDILSKGFARSNFLPPKIVSPLVKVLHLPLTDPLKGNIIHHYVVPMNRILTLTILAPFSFMFSEPVENIFRLYRSAYNTCMH